MTLKSSTWLWISDNLTISQPFWRVLLLINTSMEFLGTTIENQISSNILSCCFAHQLVVVWIFDTYHSQLWWAIRHTKVLRYYYLLCLFKNTYKSHVYIIVFRKQQHAYLCKESLKRNCKFFWRDFKIYLRHES